MRPRLMQSWRWVVSAAVLLLLLLLGASGHLGGTKTQQVLGDLHTIVTRPEFIVAILISTAPLLLAALGGLFSELSGVLNLALEAMMLCGALAAYMASLVGHSPWIGLAAAVAAGMAVGFAHAWFSITLRADQIVSAVALNLFAVAITAYIFRLGYGASSQFPSAPGFTSVSIPGLSSLPYVGPALFSNNILVYLVLALVPVIWFILYHTGWGLALRAVGEHPLAADTVGINVNRTRYIAVLISGALAGAAGSVLVSATGVNAFQENMTAGRGYVAFAAIVFGRWHPFGILLGTAIFGFGDALQIRLQAYGVDLPYQLLLLLPYVLTLVALVLFMKHAHGPASSGVAYIKEHRKGRARREAVEVLASVEQAGAPSGYALEVRKIIKRFPGVLANDHISLGIRPAEIHALLGENGAGKTTLMNVVYGLYQPDEGEILVHGKPATIDSPRKAMDLGIGMVHQHFMLVPTLSILENIVLGTESDRPPLLDLKAKARKLGGICREIGLGVPVTEKVRRLTVGQQQKVEIIKALSRGARILVLDEPTAVLTPQETVELFTLLQRLRDGGTTIVFISHKLKEVMQISDRVTVMRLGQVVQTLETSETTPVRLAELMVGRTVDLQVKKGPARVGDVQLQVNNIHATDESGRSGLRGLSLTIRAGEIHGLAGVDGNGQSELVAVLMGLRDPDRGDLVLRGQDITSVDASGRTALGLAHVPEDRHTQGLILDMTVADNLVLDVFDRKPYSERGWIRSDIVRHRARELMRAFDVRAPDAGTRVRTLSGGNQQKVVVARAIARSPSVLIVAQPTRGLDVGAISFVHSQIVEARDRGTAVLLISSDLDELLALSDIISVIYEGRILETIPAREADLTRLGLLMAGTRADVPVQPVHSPTAEIVT